MSKRLLLIVDVQEDFVRGSLPGENAESRIDNMLARAQESYDNNEAIIFTQDTHFEDTYFNTQEGKKLPILHCIKGTKGWEIIEELQKFIDEDTLIVEKETFASLDLIEDIRKYLNSGYDEVEIFGICTDICVINTASLIKNHFSELPVYVNAQCSAGVSEELHEAALKTMESFQVNIIK